MKKIYLLLCIAFITVLTSCSEQTSVENNVVKIWWYKYDKYNLHNFIIEAAIDKIKYQAELYDIEIDVRQFSYSDLSYNDYILKRNLAIEHGDLDMTFDSSGNLYDLKDKAISYDKIENYKNIFDNLKNQYCIPLCTDLRVNFINNDALIKYNIEPKNVISLDEYYEIKQRMKAEGAEFNLNAAEFDELVDYYYRKNNLEIIKEKNNLYIDKNAVLSTVYDVIDDIENNYDYDYFIKNSKHIFGNDMEYKIIEKRSGYEFSGLMYNYLALNYKEFSKNHPSIENNTIVLWDNNRYSAYAYNNYFIPCLFIPQNSKSNNVYIIADTLLSDGFQISLYNSGNAGVITNSEDVKKLIGFNKDWNYVGVKNITDENGNKVSLKSYPLKEEEKLYEVLTRGYKIVRNMDMSYFFSDGRHYWELKDFVAGMVIATIKDENILKDFDKIANDFIINLNIIGN
ncbi:hypothetical protein [Sedimentibacter sp.]|uniref:hypothetical protein n=1 Tax=Sedimentibacter sp. TaxID=1960295 RepID=UPI0028A957B9|nr:hypothetical protein [Sedimentibacter sp.]